MVRVGVRVGVEVEAELIQVEIGLWSLRPEPGLLSESRVGDRVEALARLQGFFQT